MSPKRRIQKLVSSSKILWNPKRNLAMNNKTLRVPTVLLKLGIPQLVMAKVETVMMAAMVVMVVTE